METALHEGSTDVPDVMPVLVLDKAIDGRDRLATAFRLILGIPHLLLVGGPMSAVLWWTWSSEGRWEPGGGGGVLGAAAILAALISWFAIVFTGAQPEGLWKLSAFYLRWRTRAVVYLGLLRDEYPPFGEGPYPADLRLVRPTGPRDRLTVAFRPILVIPHLLALWVLGVAWLLSTIIGWLSIIFTGRYPESLYDFATGMLRWSLRVESYILLLHDQYPPFSFA